MPKRPTSLLAALAAALLAVLASPPLAAESPAAAAGSPPPATETAPAPHPFTVHDLVGMDRISDPQVSPAGDQVVFTLSRLDLEANRRRTDLWRVPMAGGEARRLTTDPASDTSPRWAPDGKGIYFLSTRSGSPQVWRLPVGGGEAAQVTDLPLDVEGFALSPDGSRLLLALQVFPDCDTLACTADRLDARAKDKATGRLYQSLFIRHWDTWADGRRSHLFVLPAAGGAAPVDLMRGMDADSPSKPFGGMEETAFTPDGKGVVFSARNVGREEPWSTNFDLYLSPVDASKPPVDLTSENPAWDTSPVFSPDGKTLAYLAMKTPAYESDRFRVVLRSWTAGQAGPARVLTEGWDRSPGSLAFSPAGKTLYATADDVGQGALFAIDVVSGKARLLVADGTVRSPVVAPGGRIVFGRDSMRSPVELYSVAADGSGLTELTHVDAEKLAAVALGEPEAFELPGAGGDTVHGYVVKPPGLAEGAKVPVAFLIHGGPQGSFGNDFHYRWNPQTYAGAGYGVVMVDFHGSTGYGQAFTDSIQDDWGGKPLVDLQKGLAAALERYPWLDGDRVCALGASYGGFMINWIEGNWTDRFRCLVVHDGVFDQRMMYYSTEELWFPEHEQLGPYWLHPEAYEKWNPVDFVANWKTPMLVVHGGLDYRIPETQGIGAFTALQRRNVPSQMLYLPDENHWVQKPADSILWHDTVLAWLKRWLEPGS